MLNCHQRSSLQQQWEHNRDPQAGIIMQRVRILRLLSTKWMFHPTPPLKGQGILAQKILLERWWKECKSQKSQRTPRKQRPINHYDRSTLNTQRLKQHAKGMEYYSHIPQKWTIWIFSFVKKKEEEVVWDNSVFYQLCFK